MSSRFSGVPESYSALNCSAKTPSVNVWHMWVCTDRPGVVCAVILTLVSRSVEASSMGHAVKPHLKTKQNKSQMG